MGSPVSRNQATQPGLKFCGSKVNEKGLCTGFPKWFSEMVFFFKIPGATKPLLKLLTQGGRVRRSVEQNTKFVW